MITKPTKYTAEFVLEELQGMLKKIESDKEIVFKKELFLDKKYTYDRFSEWVQKYAIKKKNSEIVLAIKKIEEILETRSLKYGLNSKNNANITKFHLINNYGYTDKTETDLNVKGNIGIEKLFSDIDKKPKDK